MIRKFVPLRLKGEYPAHAEIRGEVFMARLIFSQNHRRTRYAGRKVSPIRAISPAKAPALDSSVVASR